MKRKVKKEVVKEATKKALPFIVTTEDLKQDKPAFVFVYESDRDEEIPFTSPIMNNPLFASIFAKEVSKMVHGEIRKSIGVYQLVKVG